MAGLLSGLSSLGLGNLEEMEVYEDKKEKQQEPQKEIDMTPKSGSTEADFLFDKSYECPCCFEPFKVKAVRAGKARHIGSDMDLRPKYDGIDMLKYDAIMCPNCGYAALTRYFKIVTSAQRKLIGEKITQTFKPVYHEEEVYTYETALEKYKMCLANAIVKRAKASERAYVCLKSGWLIRGMAEALDSQASDYEVRKKEYSEMEDEYLKNAMEGFIAARQSEVFPMCGMDETTVDYLLSVLAIRFGKYDIASKLVGGLIQSKNINPRMRDKARELKELLREKMKE